MFNPTKVDSSQVNPTIVYAVDKIENALGWSDSQSHTMPSPAEDGSYGTNGDAVFGFTPEQIYIETNMKYVASTVPLSFRNAVVRLAIINTEEAKQLLENSKKVMEKK